LVQTRSEHCSRPNESGTASVWSRNHKECEDRPTNYLRCLKFICAKHSGFSACTSIVGEKRNRPRVEHQSSRSASSDLVGTHGQVSAGYANRGSHWFCDASGEYPGAVLNASSSYPPSTDTLRIHRSTRCGSTQSRRGYR
jgi:hypothetical protein